MIKKFKDFNLNESSSKPRKRWPTDIKAVSLVNLIDWMSDKHGIDLREVDPKDRNTDLIHDFFFEKCDKVLFPKIPLNSLPEYKTDARYRHFIFGESIFEIPESFDTSNDFADSIEKRTSFKARMRDLLKHKYRTDAEWDKYEKDLDKHVNFGADSFEWVNQVLKLIHDDFKQHYVNGKLRVWMPQDMDYEWEPKDQCPFARPHEMDVVGNHFRKDGVYFYSDLVKYFKDKYGVDDDGFYEFIVENEYIEGRYWERVWSLREDEKNPGKLGRKLAHYQKIDKKTYKHGMDASESENVEHILNIIEKDFADDFVKSDYCGPFEIYLDIKKPVKKFDDDE